MANPFMNNKKYYKIIINILIFVLFILPTIIVLYSMLFGATYTYNQFFSLFCLFMLGLAGLFINNMPEML